MHLLALASESALRCVLTEKGVLKHFHDEVEIKRVKDKRGCVGGTGFSHDVGYQLLLVGIRDLKEGSRKSTRGCAIFRLREGAELM